LITLSKLQKIDIDETFFQSEIFQSLKDFSVEIKPQPIGRDNPFTLIEEKNMDLLNENTNVNLEN
jgi:hypothetical protein